MKKRQNFLFFFVLSLRVKITSFEQNSKDTIHVVSNVHIYDLAKEIK